MKREVWLPGGPYGPYILSQVQEAGRWVSTGARKPESGETERQFPKTTDMTNTTPQKTGGSGSDNEHSALGPSAAGRWSVCTAGPALEAANKDRIFLMKAEKVRRLTPYLEALPKDELKDHEVRGIKVAWDLYNGKTQLGFLTKEQRKDVEKTEGTEASRQGVRAHDFAEAILTGRKALTDIPEEFRHGVGGYVRYCQERTPDGVIPFVEEKVPLRHSPGDTGTVDFAAFGDEEADLADLKWGSGKLVSSIENRQFALYAINLIRLLEEDGLMSFEPDYKITMKAWQPNHHEAADLKPWTITLKDLEDFVKPIEEAAEVVRSGNGVFVVSDETCDAFCPCKSFCQARITAASAALDNPDAGYDGIDLLLGLPDDDEIPDVPKKVFVKEPVEVRLTSRLEYATNGVTGELPDATLVAFWNQKSAITKFLDDVDEHLKARVLGGESIEGLKCVFGRPGNRAWVNEDEADKWLAGSQKLKIEDRCTIKLKSPTQIEEILADKLEKVKQTKRKFEELVVRSPAGKTIAPLDDKRPAIAATAIEDLPDDLPEDEDDEGLY